MKRNGSIAKVLKWTNKGNLPDSSCELIRHLIFSTLFLPITWWTYFVNKNDDQFDRIATGSIALGIYTLLLCFGVPWFGEPNEHTSLWLVFIVMPIVGALTLLGIFGMGYFIAEIIIERVMIPIGTATSNFLGDRFCKKIVWTDSCED
jgi:hypothetical protein